MPAPKDQIKKAVWINNLGKSHKGQIPWNKGKKGNKLSEITKEKMRQKKLREKSHFWRGGIYKGRRGYIYILRPSHPRATISGYILRSHLIMEKKIGRYLTPEEVVHHKGVRFPIDSIENRQDDRPENLQLFANQSAHLFNN